MEYKYYVYINNFRRPILMGPRYKVYHYYKTLKELFTRGKCQGHLTHSLDYVKSKWPGCRVRKEPLIEMDEVMILTREGFLPPEI